MSRPADDSGAAGPARRLGLAPVAPEEVSRVLAGAPGPLSAAEVPVLLPREGHGRIRSEYLVSRVLADLADGRRVCRADGGIAYEPASGTPDPILGQPR